MRRLMSVCFLVAYLVSGALAGPPKVKVISTAGPSVPAGMPVLLDARESECDHDQPLSWQVVRPVGPVIWTFDKDDREAVAGLLVTEPGKDQVYTVAVSACAVEPQSHHVLFDTAVVEIHALFVSSPPNPPNPPNPPVPAKLARVIMVYESSANLTQNQYNILMSTAIRSKLDAICPKDCWRCWDRDVDVSGESSAWRTAWSALNGELTRLPVLVLFDDRGGHITIPLPTTIEDFLAILERYSR